MAFESLGDNCEFGLVQRYCGAEPLGLFRFSFATMDNLRGALRSRLVHYGEPGDLDVVVGPGGHLFCQSRRYWFAYHTGDEAPKTEPQSILSREQKKVAYLKERLLADLAEGAKILVRKGPPGETEAEVRGLLGDLRAYGPNVLLWVQEADADHPAGHVERVEADFLKGWVARFAPYETAVDVELESWIAVCEAAFALRGGHAPGSLLPAPGSDLAGAGGGAALAGRYAAAALPSLTIETAEPNTLYVFSAEVRIPADFAGGSLRASLCESLPFAHRAADLAVRERWQRVWASTKTRKRQTSITMALLVDGRTGSRTETGIEVRNWRLQPGVTPTIA